MKKNGFKDVTDEWLLEHEQEPIVIEEDFYIDSDGIKHRNRDVNDKGEIFSIRAGWKNKEKQDAIILSRQTGGKVIKQVEVSNPKGIRLADYRQEIGDSIRYIEQKEVSKESHSKNAIYAKSKKRKRSER